MNTDFSRFILDFPGRLAMPIGVYAGLEVTRSSVRACVSNAAVQSQAVLALHERFQTPVMLTAMDLSAEAEAFGCAIRMPEDDIPTVIGRRVSGPDEVAALPEPQPGDARTAVHLESCRRLVSQSGGAPVLGGLIGPFSLAGRIFGVSEALEATLADPDTILALLEKVTRFLCGYAAAFRAAGASGVIMAEPAAGLLSPRGLGRFSAPFVRQIVEAVQDEHFTLVLHNCGAKLVHLPQVLQSGAEVYHFGAPMDILAALAQVDGRAILGGNLDPSAIFHAGTPASVEAAAAALLDGVGECRNFFLSSGCDLPPGTPVANLDAFYQAAAKQPVLDSAFISAMVGQLN
jgi:uroporphyrinogen decarboxylase